MPQSVVNKFSRRTGEIELLADKLGIENPQSKDKLGATSRLRKREDMTLADYRKYWQGRITPGEAHLLKEVIEAARKGENPRPENTAEKGMAWAIQHSFERNSVVDWHDLAITAMERCMGGALPEEIEPEARKQGVLLKDGEATTKEVLAEEQRVIAFAREGRGTCRGMGSERLRAGLEPFSRGQAPERVTTPAAAYSPDHSATLSPDTQLKSLSPDQAAVARHIWTSTDRVIMIEGDAGTGKTQTMQRTIPGIDKPGVFLAPSASASRGTLREKGFTNADTIRMFLDNEKFREKARGGYIYIDEAPLAGLKDIDQVFQHAKALNARVILQGDRKQHKSVARGNLFEILDKYAGLPIGRLTKNWRQQKDDYKAAVNAIAKGDILKGYDKLVAMKAVVQTDHNKPLVDDYLSGLSAGKEMLVVAPTHKEGNEITEVLRSRLRAEGRIGTDERAFETLRPLGWTDAQKGDVEMYTGEETLQFHRNSGAFKAGQRVKVAELKAGQRLGNAANYSVYTRNRLGLSGGDHIRITANGKTQPDKDGNEHKLNNGSVYTVKGFTKEGDVALTNGWVVGKDFQHITHGYVSTSFGSQGRTVDSVLIAMGKESLPAINAEQFYVSVSRGRESARIYTDLSSEQMREAIQKKDVKKSATELMGSPKAKKSWKDRYLKLMARARKTVRALKQRAFGDTEKQQQRSCGHER